MDGRINHCDYQVPLNNPPKPIVSEEELSRR